MELKITPESTHTPYAPDPSEPRSTLGDAEHRFPFHDGVLGAGQTLDLPAPEHPPEHLLLGVVMGFTGATVRLDAVEIGAVAEGKSVWEAFRRLIEETRVHLASSESGRAELLRYPPTTWFRFVPPAQSADANRAALADGFADALNPLYEFRGDSVRDFLAGNPYLVGLLFETHGVIGEHFGPKTKTALEVVADPEALGDRQLFVLIRTQLPRTEARARLAELDRTWWFDALPTSKGKMEIALD